LRPYFAALFAAIAQGQMGQPGTVVFRVLGGASRLIRRLLVLKAFLPTRAKSAPSEKTRAVFRRCGGLGQSKALSGIAAVFFCARHGSLDRKPQRRKRLAGSFPTRITKP
jgi:hypothetical protein